MRAIIAEKKMMKIGELDSLSTASLSTPSLSTAGLSTPSLSTRPFDRQPVYRHDRLIDTTVWSTRPFDRHDRFIDNSIFIKDFRHNFTLAWIKIIFWNFVYRCIWSPQFEYERIFYRSQVIFEIIDFTFLIDLILIMIFLYKFIKFTRDFDLIWPNLT